MKTQGATVVKVNYGKLLEDQLKKWQGGGHHPRGIGEYITNSDDSYRRLGIFKGQDILITIKSRRGKMIDELTVEDCGEGMSYDDLEGKFFQYFESFAGRERGEKVTGRFGTGGKAYAIMNFRHCWIISTKDNLECRSWFKWNIHSKEIINGYDGLGYIDKKVHRRNGTKIILEDSYKVSYPLDEFINKLENSTRIRHVLKNQNVRVSIESKGRIKEIILRYNGPNENEAKTTWEFDLPDTLLNSDEDTKLKLLYFEKPLGEHSFIDLSDGISSVADLSIAGFDGRPFSRYINGSLTLTKLADSPAVKENRKGLEEGDDLTIDIEEFIGNKVTKVINEIEIMSRDREKEVRINNTNSKLKELSKFLSKKDLNFKLELKELQKRFMHIDSSLADENEEENSLSDKLIYRNPVKDDPAELLIKGRWITKEVLQGETDVEIENPQPEKLPEFIPDQNGEEFAVEMGRRKRSPSSQRKTKKGLNVLMSNNPEVADCPFFSQYDDPVSDRDLVTKGTIWINSVHPMIANSIESKEDEKVFHEHIVNFVLMIVAQFYAQKELEFQPEDERDDPLLLFRKHFFELQREIRADKEISYFDSRN